MAEIVAPLREMIMEAVAETDEALMVKYFNGEEFTFDEIKQAIRKGVKDGVSRSNLIGKKPLLNMVLFTMVFGGGMIPLFLVVKGLGMYDTYSALILPGAISAYNMIIVRNFFMELPRELEEAASIDGCSDIGIFIKIALPLSLPCLATFGLFYAVGHWNNYFGALLYLEDSTKFPFQLVLRNIVMQTAETQTDPNALIPEDTLKMAVIVIGTVPILIVYPFLQKHFAAGVMVGAVKG